MKHITSISSFAVFIGLVIAVAMPSFGVEPGKATLWGVDRKWTLESGQSLQARLVRVQETHAAEKGDVHRSVTVVLAVPKFGELHLDVTLLGKDDQDVVRQVFDCGRESPRELTPAAASFTLQPHKDGPVFRFLYIPPGEFVLGYTDADIERLIQSGAGGDFLNRSDCQPPLTVQMRRGFFILDQEVSCEQLAVLLGLSDAPELEDLRKLVDAQKGGSKPFGGIKWQEAIDCCSVMDRLAPQGFTIRLPTEIEWEYAARGPRNRLLPWADGPVNRRPEFLASGDVKAVNEEDGDRSWREVCGLGGNVSEWCLDEYNSKFYEQLKETKGVEFEYDVAWPAFGKRGPLDVAIEHSCRGGCFADRTLVESPMRNRQLDNRRNVQVGFRPVLVPKGVR